MSVTEPVAEDILNTTTKTDQHQDIKKSTVIIAAPADIQVQPASDKPEARTTLDSVSDSRCPTPATPNSEKKMNGLSFSELCCLFCCPPWPGRIAAKLAFLPPEPTYSFLPDETNTKFTLNLTDRAEWQYTQRELDNIEVFYTRTSKNNRIGCMHIRTSPNPRFTILFSHGNAVDLGQMSSFYLGLGSRINCNIFSYDYSGYGVSGGKPSEKNLYADIEAAWLALRSKFGISPEHIIVYGQSIGTVPTVDLAARYEVGAVVLHSPLMSGMRVAFPNTKRTWFFDAFPSIDKVPKVTSPVLVIHGTEDEVIDFSHGLAMYERCPRAVEPLWVEGGGHNDIELYSQYLERLKQFITVDLA
jgi:pimeloyl-ACP methyl ester carboxylesterase